jgi:hypothetical protein
VRLVSVVTGPIGGRQRCLGLIDRPKTDPFGSGRLEILIDDSVCSRPLFEPDHKHTRYHDFNRANALTKQ